MSDNSIIQNPQRILLIQLRAIGDVLLTTPAVRAVKQRFPDAEIDFVANTIPAESLHNNPNIHEIIPYPYKKNDIIGALKYYYKIYRNNYDIVIDFLGTPATAQMTYFSRAPVRIGYELPGRRFAYNYRKPTARADIYNALAKMSLLEPLGITNPDPYPEIFISENDRDWADRLFREKGWDAAKQVIAMAPAAKNPARQWLLEYFAKVGSVLQSRGYSVILLWGPGEEGTVRSVADRMQPSGQLSPRTTLMQLAAIMERCSLLVCNCGGTKHFAVAVGTPTIAVYGASIPEAWTPPDDPLHVCLQADLDCLHCSLRECDDMSCMKDVTPEIMIEAIENMCILPDLTAS